MISHRGAAFMRVTLCLFGLTLAACDRATDPTQPSLRSGPATFDKKPVPKGVISARVLTNKAGVSVLEVRTGTFDNATNTGTPDGTFEKIEYTIYQNDPGKKPKKIFERNVNFKKSRPNFFSEVISICKKSDEDDPPREHRDGGHYDDHYDHGDDQDGPYGHDDHDQKPQPPCPLLAGKSYSISIEADLEGVGAAKKDDAEVRDTAVFYNNPEIDLSAEKVQMVITTSPRATSDILLATVDSTTTYQTRFVNSSTAVGIRVTCEVHVFNSTNNDVTLSSGLTYRWRPNGGAPYNATKPGSAASDTTTIKPGEPATCEFTLKLKPIGSYRIEVTANAVYPSDWDPSNNKTSGTVRVITGIPVFPPPGEGFGSNTNANDFGFYAAFTATNPQTFFDYRGDSAQTAAIDSLSSTVIDGNGLTGTYTVKLHFYTVDSVEKSPATATRNLADATWSGSLVTLSALALGPGGTPCISSDAAGILTPAFRANGNVAKLIMCITPIKNSPKYKISISFQWTPPANPPLAVSKANGAVSYGDFLYFDVDLGFSDFKENPVAHAPVALNVDPGLPLLPGQMTFGAVAKVRRYH